MGLVYWYICIMKNEIEIPDHFPDAKEKDLKAAAKRREEYSIVRDLRAKEENEAIARRLLRDKENKSEDKTD
jgi:hypothetical protein